MQKTNFRKRQQSRSILTTILHMSVKSPQQCSSQRHSKGYSLLEIIIAMIIFSMVTVGILRGVLQARSMAEHSVYQSSAITVATGFIEQIKAMAYTELESLANGSASEMVFIIANGEENTVENGIETSLAVPLDADEEGETTLTMDLNLLVNISPVTGIDAVQVDLLYGFILPLTNKPITSSISTIVSDVPTY